MEIKRAAPSRDLQMRRPGPSKVQDTRSFGLQLGALERGILSTTLRPLLSMRANEEYGMQSACVRSASGL